MTTYSEVWKGVQDRLREPVLDAILECRDQGYPLVPYFGLRTLSQQNRLYRQSRPLSTIQDKIKELRDKHAPYLADQLAHTPPCKAGYVTNSVGGLSWHNWGLAVDCYLKIGNTPVWSDHPGYTAFGEAVTRRKLKWGGTFKRLRDVGHVQFHLKEPWELYTYPEIDAHFQSQEPRKEHQ
jgi:peptidoglycan LD-endopeptidase CwlK